MSLQNEIANFQNLKATNEAAEDAARAARHNLYAAARALETKLLDAVPPTAINRAITINGEECMIVSKVVPVQESDVVRPYVLRKIAKGKAWGKTRSIANKVFWDFEAGDWKVEG